MPLKIKKMKTSKWYINEEGTARVRHHEGAILLESSSKNTVVGDLMKALSKFDARATFNTYSDYDERGAAIVISYTQVEPLNSYQRNAYAQKEVKRKAKRDADALENSTSLLKIIERIKGPASKQELLQTLNDNKLTLDRRSLLANAIENGTITTYGDLVEFNVFRKVKIDKTQQAADNLEVHSAIKRVIANRISK